MPDPGKHEALETLGFKIAKLCVTCIHWSGQLYGWGKCSLAQYDHAKHSERMNAGTPAVGTCSQHETDHGAIRTLCGDDYTERYKGEA